MILRTFWRLIRSTAAFVGLTVLFHAVLYALPLRAIARGDRELIEVVATNPFAWLYLLLLVAGSFYISFFWYRRQAIR